MPVSASLGQVQSLCRPQSHSWLVMFLLFLLASLPFMSLLAVPRDFYPFLTKLWFFGALLTPDWPGRALLKASGLQEVGQNKDPVPALAEGKTTVLLQPSLGIRRESSGYCFERQSHEKQGFPRSASQTTESWLSDPVETN